MDAVTNPARSQSVVNSQSELRGQNLHAVAITTVASAVALAVYLLTPT
jgi:hypothetical protein